MRRAVICVAAALLVISCMRPEKPWPRSAVSEASTLAASLGPEYDTIAFLSLSQGLMHKVPRTAWDIEIHSTSGGYQVWTNAAMYAFVAVLDSPAWTAASDPSTLAGWKCDLLDSAAIPFLAYGQTITLVLDRDRGAIFYTSSERRYKKLQIKALPGRVEVRAYTLRGEPAGEWSLARVPVAHYISLERPGEPVSVLPPWPVEVVLTRYIHFFPNQPEAYRYYPVTGALVPKGCRVAVMRTAQIPFEKFTYAELASVEWSTRRDAIGYDWKRYDFDTGTYLVDLSRYFLLQTGPESYYKLQFVDFYDEEGRKGYVKLRYNAL